MSERLEIENLTRSLSQIVSTLQALSSKQLAAPEKETNRIKKTPDMTYMAYLLKVLSNRSPVEVTLKKQTYSLQEDLELLLELSSYSSITSKSFE